MNAVINKASNGGRWRLACAVLIIVAAFSLGGAGIALGAAPSAAGDQYTHPKPKPKPKPTTVVAGASSGAASTSPANAGATLPFTGVSLIWPAIGAIILVSLGLGLRRHDRKNS